MYNVIDSVKKLNKFQLGQLIFILAITIGPFVDDTVRKIMLFLAICCLSKKNFTEKLRSSWSGKYKLYGCSTIMFWALLLFIPLIFGVDDLKERFIGLGWPIEMIVWIWAAITFAKDAFFIKSLKNVSIAVCGIYSLIALPVVIAGRNVQNYGIYGLWPLTQSSFATGAILCCLIVWMIYSLFAESDSGKFGKALIFPLFIITSVTIFLTFRRTFWLAVLAELFAAAIALLLTSKTKFYKFAKGFGILCAGFFIIFSLVTIQDNPAFENALKKRFGQIFSLRNNDITTFTSKRDLVWRDAIYFIKARPLTGYGFAEYENFTKSFGWPRNVAHSHSTFFQIAWTAGLFPCLLFICNLLLLLYICLSELKKRGPNCTLPFVVLLIVAASISGGLFEELFKNTRRATTLYWVYLSLPLSKAFILNLTTKKDMDSYDA